MSEPVSTKSPNSAASIPGVFLTHMEDCVRDLGVKPDSLYTAAAVNRKNFVPMQDFVSEHALNDAIREAIAITGRADFGLLLGSRLSVNNFGLLSTALINSANLGNAMQLMERYSSLVLSLVSCMMRTEQQRIGLEIIINSPYPLLKQTIMEAVVACWPESFRLLTGKELQFSAVHLAFKAPPYAEKFSHYMPCEFVFSADSNIIYLPKSLLQIPFVTGNSVAEKISLEQCEQYLIRRKTKSTLGEKILDLLHFYLDQNPSIGFIAAKLNLTERTLRRHLAQENVSFREALHKVRHEKAIYYLEQTDLQISQIALKLGYQETSNFRAAFKKWTAMSPKQWRDNYLQQARHSSR